ncbi:MAG: S1 RNA-binding domain-containing protein [Acidaminococcales bacterium]|jgi:S1 RNA binding domain protein|nr:S1 RNA-binding domain-containing protein [Acidaminococcales bacterium]
MAIEAGSVIEGVITRITNFGAFVELPENNVGLVHISEVSDLYVRDVHDFLKEKEKVKVKVLSVDPRGKIGLSIKQASPENKQRAAGEARIAAKPAVRPAGRPPVAAASFEDKISRFLKDSEDRLTDLKKNTETKRGGRGANRRSG